MFLCVSNGWAFHELLFSDFKCIFFLKAIEDENVFLTNIWGSKLSWLIIDSTYENK